MNGLCRKPEYFIIHLLHAYQFGTLTQKIGQFPAKRSHNHRNKCQYDLNDKKKTDCPMRDDQPGGC